MELLRLGADLPAEWDDVCSASVEAWAWQRRPWLEYSRQLAGDRLVAEINLAISDRGALVAVAPCSAVATDAGVVVGLGGDAAPWPAFRPLDDAGRRRAEQLVFDGLREVAEQHDAVAVRLQSSPLSPLFGGGLAPACMPVRHGWDSRVRDSCIVDLDAEASALLSRVRKGHRADIKRGESALTVEVWRGDVDDEVFDAYRSTHALAAGRVTRDRRTFDLMRDWVRDDTAILVGARRDATWAGFVYVLTQGDGAFYASACNNPDVADELPVGHVLVWRALIAAKLNGAHRFEMGLQEYARPWVLEPDKLVGIGRFKRGFGGAPAPVFQSELGRGAA